MKNTTPKKYATIVKITRPDDRKPWSISNEIADLRAAFRSGQKTDKWIFDGDRYIVRPLCRIVDIQEKQLQRIDAFHKKTIAALDRKLTKVKVTPAMIKRLDDTALLELCKLINGELVKRQSKQRPER